MGLSKGKEKAVSRSKKVNQIKLLENDAAILESIQALYQKVDSMDKGNKKFLMAATLNGGKTEGLEKELYHMKMNMVALLDQIDLLVSAICSNNVEEMKQNLGVFRSKIVQLAVSSGLEEIEAECGSQFQAQEQECIESVSRMEQEDNTIVDLFQRGYRDKTNGKVLRCAKVSVNKRQEGEDSSWEG